MPDQNREVLVRSLTGPVENKMKKRASGLAKKKMSGGMFDIIFKKRMERQNEISKASKEM